VLKKQSKLSTTNTIKDEKRERQTIKLMSGNGREKQEKTNRE